MVGQLPDHTLPTSQVLAYHLINTIQKFFSLVKLELYKLPSLGKIGGILAGCARPDNPHPRFFIVIRTLFRNLEYVSRLPIRFISIIIRKNLNGGAWDTRN